MIDPITKLPTPVSMLGGRQVVSPFPLPGLSGLGQAAQAATAPLASTAPSAASGLPSWATGLAGRIAPGSIGGGEALTSTLARGAGLPAVPGGAAAGGLLSRLPSMGGIFTAGSAASKLGASVGGLGYGTAGMVGSHLIDKLNPGGQNSNLEQGLQGAATGAGIGAGLGLLGGPLAPLTSSGGALIGGAIGGALGILGNTLGLGGGGEDEDAPDPIEILGTGIQAAQLDPDSTEEILQTYEVLTALAEMRPEGEERDAAMAQAFDTSAAMILQAMQQKEQVASQAANTLALQAQAQDIFAPLAQDITDSSMLYANAMKGIRDTLPESYQPIADATVARELSSAQRLASAYQAQAAVTPVVNRLTQYQQDYNNLAAQQFSQALAQQAAGGSASLGPSSSDVLAALTPTG